MQTVQYGSKEIVLDDEGYLADYEAWDEGVACGLAEREGIEELTEERIEILRFMRSYYRQFNSFPMLRAVCKNVHQPRECVSEEFMDPMTAWRIAGLPNPGPEVIFYLSPSKKKD